MDAFKDISKQIFMNYKKYGSMTVKSKISDFFLENGNENAEYGVNQGIFKILTRSMENRDGRILYENNENISTIAKRLFDKLIKQGFSDVDADLIMHSIDNIGVCSYASATEIIIDYFKDKQDLFKEKFGYDLITNDYGNKSINGAELLLDLFVWANTESNGGTMFLDDHSINMDLMKTSEYLDKNQVYFSNSSGFNCELLNKFLASKGLKIETNNKYYRSREISLEKSKQMVKEHLSKNLPIAMGIYGKTTIYSSWHVQSMGDNGHSIFITGISDLGFICTSWSKEFLIPFTEYLSDDRNYVDLIEFIELVD